MALQFFMISVQDQGTAGEALNQFVQSHKVLNMERHFVNDGANSFWTVCVSYLDGEGRPQQPKKSKIDYREVLSEADFTVYARIRALRKELSEKEGVPAFALFTNEQLADLVRRRVTTPSGLSEIEGVGDARVKKYGQAFLAVLKDSFSSLPPASQVGGGS